MTLLDNHYKQQLVGTINSYIRIINESDKYDPIGKGIIQNEWESYLTDNGDTFVAILTIQNKKETFTFPKEEWKDYNISMLQNKQLQQLMKQYC